MREHININRDSITEVPEISRCCKEVNSDREEGITPNICKPDKDKVNISPLDEHLDPKPGQMGVTPLHNGDTGLPAALHFQ